MTERSFLFKIVLLVLNLDKVPLALLLGKNPLQLSTDLVTVYKENEIIAIYSKSNWSYRLDTLHIASTLTVENLEK